MNELRSKRNAYLRKRWKSDPIYRATIGARNSRNYFLRKHKISKELADSMLVAQGGVCAICGTAKSGGRSGRFHVDHDHRTGIIRGMLCNRCNVALGGFGDDQSILKLAIEYLSDVR